MKALISIATLAGLVLGGCAVPLQQLPVSEDPNRLAAAIACRGQGGGSVSSESEVPEHAESTTIRATTETVLRVTEKVAAVTLCVCGMLGLVVLAAAGHYSGPLEFNKTATPSSS
jgi:hypothetical protein